MHVILAPKDRHKKAYPDVPLIRFRNGKSLKDHLVRSQIPDIEEIGMSKPCGGKGPFCHLCRSMKDTRTFKIKRFDEAYKCNNDYNCNSKIVGKLSFGQGQTIIKVRIV